MNQVIAIVGPTAVGKSNLALALAQTLNAEIVNADSCQVYRYMDIGTAKPSLEDRTFVQHHLIDIVEPDETFSLALFHKLACHAIEDIQGRGRLALLVGGSGLYIWSVVEGWQLPQVPPDLDFRRRMENLAAREGPEVLYRQLDQVDPEAARKIDPRNIRRVIRALEVFEAKHIPYSQLQIKHPPPFDTFILGLTTDREELYQAIDIRVDEMLEAGLVEEVNSLTKRGFGFDLPAMSSMGYRQIGHFIQGEIDLPTAVQQIKFDTHRFARHQYAWFRLKDPRIHWLDIRDDLEERALLLIRERIAG